MDVLFSEAIVKGKSIRVFFVVVVVVADALASAG